MNILVTGGAGFIGSTLVDELISLGHEVSVIDNLSTGKKEFINPKARFHQVDIRDFGRSSWMYSGIDYVFHLAALPGVQPSIKNPTLYHDVNVNGTLTVLRCCLETGARVGKLIFSSSSSVYGNYTIMPLVEELKPQPMSPYALQKYIGEQYCQLYSKIYKLPTVCLRYFNVYGERQPKEGAYATVIGIFQKQKANRQYLTINGDGQQRRDFVYVKDVVQANILAAASNLKNGEVFNIGSGNNFSVNQVARMIGHPRIHVAPKIEPRETLADINKARVLLKWKPKGNLKKWIKESKTSVD